MREVFVSLVTFRQVKRPNEKAISFIPYIQFVRLRPKGLLLMLNKISNVDLYKKTGCNSAVLEIKRRRLRWLGHVLRMPGNSIPKVALRWTPPGKRKRRRPKMTWRQTVMAELREMGLSWGEAHASAKDRTLWRKIVVALCPTGDEEDK